MGNSVLVKRTHTHSAVAESEQRLRMVQIRDRIHESRVLDLCLAMAISGKDLHFNPRTMELEGEELLDQKVRQSYVNLLLNKLVNNAVAPKEFAPEDSHAKWAEVIRTELEDGAGNDS